MPSASIRVYPRFDARADADGLRSAMKGFGCDKAAVVEILCGRCNAQRQQIAVTYKATYGRDLCEDLRKELSGNLETVMVALMQPPVAYIAWQLHDAMAGPGTRESTLIEVMCSRNNAEITVLKKAYRQMYGKELEDELSGETSGWFRNLLISLCTARRDESMTINPDKAREDARELHRAGERRWGTDESCFQKILATQNYAHLRRVFDEYDKVSGHSIEKAIQSEFSGNIRDAYIALISCIRNRAGYFAWRLNNSMKGFGTRDKDLIRIVVSRSEIDLIDIREEYAKLYKSSLEKDISGDTSGQYRDALLALVRGNV